MIAFTRVTKVKLLMRQCEFDSIHMKVGDNLLRNVAEPSEPLLNLPAFLRYAERMLWG